MAKRQKEHQIAGACFYGNTVRDAKVAAEQAINDAFTGDYTPLVVSYEGYILIVYRHAWEGWNYRILEPDDLAEIRETPIGAYAFSHGEPMDRETALRRGCEHLAQRVWIPEHGVKAPRFVKWSDVRVSVESWQRWQLRYAYFKAQGATDNQCHSLASDSRQVTPFDR